VESEVSKDSPVTLKEVRSLLRYPVAFYASFARIAGSANGGLFLSQCVYWTGKTQDCNGWFYKTQKHWEKELNLSRHEQETVRRELVRIGILEEVIKGIPPKVHYKLNLESLACALRHQEGTVHHIEAPNPSDSKGEKTENRFAEKPQFFYQETTYKEKSETANTRDSETLSALLTDIQAAHPRPQFGEQNRSTIRRAIEEEGARQGCSLEQIARDVLQKTQRYAEAVSAWPEEQKRYVISSSRFFEDRIFLQDESIWERRPINGGEQIGESIRRAVQRALGAAD
jgi:hypothetical protein